MAEKKRPLGVSAFVFVNFFLAGLHLQLLILGLIGHKITNESAADPIKLAGLVLLVVSGFGFLRCHRVAGYLAGNLWALLTLGDFFLSRSMAELRADPLIGLALIYPVTLLLLLNLRYRRCFLSSPEETASEQAP